MEHPKPGPTWTRDDIVEQLVQWLEDEVAAIKRTAPSQSFASAWLDNLKEYRPEAGQIAIDQFSPNGDWGTDTSQWQAIPGGVLLPDDTAIQIRENEMVQVETQEEREQLPFYEPGSDLSMGGGQDTPAVVVSEFWPHSRRQRAFISAAYGESLDFGANQTPYDEGQTGTRVILDSRAELEQFIELLQALGEFVWPTVEEAI